MQFVSANCSSATEALLAMTVQTQLAKTLCPAFTFRPLLKTALSCSYTRADIFRTRRTSITPLSGLFDKKSGQCKPIKA